MERPRILHMFTPGQQMSPFDINMAADAGYDMVPIYSEVTLDRVAGLTQDAIFSRGPRGVSRTGIFIGGRDVLLAADMVDKAVAAMVPPFVVSVFADPSGSYTTAAAMVACVEAGLRTLGKTLAGLKVVVIGGTGTVGRIAGVIAAQQGARVCLSTHFGESMARQAAAETGARFGVTLEGSSGGDRHAVQRSLAEADVLLATVAAGIQVVLPEDLAVARRLLVAADVNAVPPAGIAGIGMMDKLSLLPGTQALAIGPLAIGNVKYQTQHRLLKRMCESDKPVTYSFPDAFEVAREVLAEEAATP